MKKIRSYEDAYEVAERIYNGLNEGETVSGNAIHFRKVGIKLAVTGSEFNYNEAHKYGYDVNKECRMVTCELADFVLFPERKRINDALEVLESQLEKE